MDIHCNSQTNGRKDVFGKFAKRVSYVSGKPAVFLLAMGVIAVWAITGPIFKFNDTWQLVINTGTTIVTFLMVFLIQNTQNRDTEAVQLKLDEIIRALDAAHNEMISLEDKSQDELDEVKQQYLELADATQDEIDSRQEERSKPRRKAS